MKKQNTYRLTEAADRWITQQAKQQGLSKNDIIQILINKAMESEAGR